MLRTGRTDDGIAGVEGAADRYRSLWRRVWLPCARHELDRSVQPGTRVVLAADATEEQADDLVADHLVDQSVVAEDRLRSEAVEPSQVVAELGRRQSFPEGGRAADVGEQQRHRDLSAGHAHPPELRDAVLADRGIAGEAAEAEVADDSAADPTERCPAELAARVRRQMLEAETQLGQPRVFTSQDLPKLIPPRVVRHRSTVRRSLVSGNHPGRRT
jgi:hypothetical protein